MENIELQRIFTILDKFNMNWFLSGESCLEYCHTGKPFFRNRVVNLGIYGTDNIKDAISNLPVKRITYYNSKIASVFLQTAIWVHLHIFLDLNGYIVEARHNEMINRYRLLSYERSIITDGIEEAFYNNKKFRVLIRRKDYSKALFGNNLLGITHKWNEWNDPHNIIWEDFIQRPIPLV